MRRIYNKEKSIRLSYQTTNLERLALKFLIDNNFLPTILKLNASYRLSLLGSRRSQIKNICLVSCRSRSVFRFFRLSRIMIRELGLAGKLTGLRKLN